jgi:hypothetical protein
MREARNLIERAKSHLAIFPLSATRRTLSELGEFVLNRQQ